MVPAEVYDDQEPVHSTLYGREIDITLPASHPRNTLCNGFDVTDAACNVFSSIRRMYEHHMVPAGVYDGQEPAHSTLYGREIDITAPGAPRPETLRETV